MACLSSRQTRRLFVPSVLLSLVSFAFAASCGGSSGSPLLDAPDPSGGATGSAPPTTGDGSRPVVGSGPTDAGNPSDTGGGGPGDASGDADAGPTPDASPIVCVAPKANCSGNPSDGCNVDTSSDNANCGGCGIVCAGGCAKGVCPLIQTTPPPVGDFACIAIDANNVYLANGRATPNGAVLKVPLSGGSLTSLASGLATPHGITSDGTSVYFTTTVAAGQIFKVPADGSSAAISIVSAQPRPIDIVARPGAIYWLDQGDLVATGGSIWTSGTDGKNPTQLIGTLGVNRVGHLRVDASTIFFTDSAYGVRSIPITGAATASGVVEGALSRFLDISATTVFFSAGAAGAGSTVLSGPLTGNDVQPDVVAQLQGGSRGVATDGIHVYWADAGVTASTGEIWRADLDGKNPVRLASAQNFPACIAVDGTSVYWINEAGGMISKTAK
jgi:hypothetical protein